VLLVRTRCGRRRRSGREAARGGGPDDVSWGKATVAKAVALVVNTAPPPAFPGMVEEASEARPYRREPSRTSTEEAGAGGGAPILLPLAR